MPKTWSTSSALGHSMMAATARIGRASLAARNRFSGPVEIPATPHADLVVERHHVAALRALAPRLGALEAVQHGRDRAEHRQHEPDQEPDEERGALDLPDDARGQAEEEQQDQEAAALHGSRPRGRGWPR